MVSPVFQLSVCMDTPWIGHPSTVRWYKAWLEFCNLEADTSLISIRSKVLCSQHFAPVAYLRTGRLRWDAVPTLKRTLHGVGGSSAYANQSRLESSGPSTEERVQAVVACDDDSTGAIHLHKMSHPCHAEECGTEESQQQRDLSHQDHSYAQHAPALSTQSTVVSPLAAVVTPLPGTSSGVLRAVSSPQHLGGGSGWHPPKDCPSSSSLAAPAQPTKGKLDNLRKKVHQLQALCSAPVFIDT
ncbi:uncharacterized protein LOC135376511 isoform X1 [Ornithodoros turicata]|uniref:uncharacterized protein LOC135376511 isoform X1 n=3 Tax=Ornithodoros turicata TaxID=34597 RepID=UPI0031386DED